MAAGQVVINIMGTAKGFKSAMDDAEGKLKTSESGMSKHSAAIATGLAAAGTAAAAFGVQAVDSYENAARESLKLSRYMGNQTDEASRWRYIAQQSGLGADDLTKSFAKMSKQMEGGKAFEEAGVSTRNLDGSMRSMTDVLLDTSRIFEMMPNGPEKTALAMQLFGKSGADMIPILNKGVDGIQAMMAESDKYGLTLNGSAEDVKANIAAQRQMSAAWEGAKIQLGEKLMPYVSKFAEFMADHLPGALQNVTGFITRFQDGLVVMGDGFSVLGDKIMVWRDRFTGVWWQFQDGWDIVTQAFVNGWHTINGMWQQFQQGWDIVSQAFVNGWHVIVGIWQWGAGVIDTVVDAVVGAAVWMNNAVTGVWNTLYGAVARIVGGIASVVGSTWSNIYNTVVWWVNAASGAVQWVWGGIVGFVQGLGGSIANAASGMWNGIVDGAKGAVNAVLRAWNGLDIAVGPWSIPDWVPGLGGKTFSIPDLFPDVPYLAKGGVAMGPTTAVVGEGGQPEAIVPLDRWADIVGAGPGGAGSDGRLASLVERLIATVDTLIRQGRNVYVYPETDADADEIGKTTAWSMKTAGV